VHAMTASFSPSVTTRYSQILSVGFQIRGSQPSPLMPGVIFAVLPPEMYRTCRPIRPSVARLNWMDAPWPMSTFSR